QLSPLSEKFDAIRAEFETLGASTQKKLAKRFEIFNHLDEVEALVAVFDNLLFAASTACENLQGFSHCEQL
ncbi:hypothetical protein PMAYCL1PPCAC_28095, partial [Pristionchus mayeri]